MERRAPGRGGGGFRASWHSKYRPSRMKKPKSEVNAPSTNFTDECLDVMITYPVSKSEYFVVHDASNKVLHEIHNSTKERFSRQPSMNALYLCKYVDHYGRAEVISTKPLLKVRFIDFGYEIHTNELYKLPSKWFDIEPLAFKITITPQPREMLTEGAGLKIRRRNDNTWEIIEAEHTSELSSSEGRIQNDLGLRRSKTSPLIELNNSFPGVAKNHSKKPNSPGKKTANRSTPPKDNHRSLSTKNECIDRKPDASVPNSPSNIVPSMNPKMENSPSIRPSGSREDTVPANGACSNVNQISPAQSQKQNPGWQKKKRGKRNEKPESIEGMGFSRTLSSPHIERSYLNGSRVYANGTPNDNKHPGARNHVTTNTFQNSIRTHVDGNLNSVVESDATSSTATEDMSSNLKGSKSEDTSLRRTTFTQPVARTNQPAPYFRNGSNKPQFSQNRTARYSNSPENRLCSLPTMNEDVGREGGPSVQNRVVPNLPSNHRFYEDVPSTKSSWGREDTTSKQGDRPTVNKSRPIQFDKRISWLDEKREWQRRQIERLNKIDFGRSQTSPHIERRKSSIPPRDVDLNESKMCPNETPIVNKQPDNGNHVASNTYQSTKSTRDEKNLTSAIESDEMSITVIGNTLNNPKGGKSEDTNEKRSTTSTSPIEQKNLPMAESVSYSVSTLPDHHHHSVPGTSHKNEDVPLNKPNPPENQTAKSFTPIDRKRNTSVPTVTASPLPSNRVPNMSHGKNVPLNVMITCRESKSEYWVVKDEDVEALARIHRSSRVRQPNKLFPNHIYMCEFDNYGCRVRVIKWSPLTVHYIDYGNEEMIHQSRLFLCDLPEDLKTKQPLAFKIKLWPSPASALQEERRIVIKRINNDTWELVHSGPEILETNSSSRVMPDNDARNYSTPKTEEKQVSSAKKNDLKSCTAVQKGTDVSSSTSPKSQSGDRSQNEKHEKETTGDQIDGEVISSTNQTETKDLVNETKIEVKKGQMNDSKSSNLWSDEVTSDIEEEKRRQTATLKSMLFSAPKKSVENVDETSDRDSAVVDYISSSSPAPVEDDTTAREAEAEAKVCEKRVDTVATESDHDSGVDEIILNAPEVSCTVESEVGPQKPVEKVSDGISDQEPTPVEDNASACETKVKVEVDDVPTKNEHDSSVQEIISDAPEVSTTAQSEAVVVSDVNVADTPSKTVSSSVLEMGKTSIVTVVGGGWNDEQSEKRYVYKVVLPKVLSAYKKLMDDLQTEGEMFDSCYMAKLGELYAAKNIVNDSFHRVKVTCETPTLMEYIDDGHNVDGNAIGAKYYVEVCDEEYLYKLPSRYTDDALVPSSIRLIRPMRLEMDSEIVIIPREKYTSVATGGTIWSVEVVSDDDDDDNDDEDFLDAQNDIYDDMIDEEEVIPSTPVVELEQQSCTIEEVTEDDLTPVVELEQQPSVIEEVAENDSTPVVVPKKRSVVLEEVINDLIPRSDIEAGVCLYVWIAGTNGASVYTAVPSKKKGEYLDLIEEMQTEGRNFGKLYGEFKMGKLYAIKRNDCLHRVQVICTKPPTVEFLDTGKTDQFNADELLVLPDKYKRPDLIPFSITFDIDQKMVEYDIVINPVERIHPNHWFVYLDAKLDPIGPELQCSLPESLNTEWTFEKLGENEVARFIPCYKFGPNCVTGSLVPDALKKSIMEMNDRLNNIPADPNYWPKLGKVIVAFVNDDEVLVDLVTRALVLREPTPLHAFYTVFCIDYGKVQLCDKVAHLPPELLDVPAVSTMCTIKRHLDDSEADILVCGKYTFETKKKLDDGSCAGVLTEISSSSKFEVVYRKMWPLRGDFVGYVSGKTGDRVKLFPFEVTSECHVSLSDEYIAAQRRLMNLHVSIRASKSPPNEDPLLFDVVAVLYKRSLWRGKVLEKEEDDYFLVQLMDLGKQLSVRREHMRTIPPYLQEILCTAIPITLKGVHVGRVDERKHKDLLKFLKAGYNLELVVEEDGEVTLKFLPDVNYDPIYTRFDTVNEYFDFCFTPFWLACLKNGMIFEPRRVLDEELLVEERDWIVGRTLSLSVTSVDVDAGCVFVRNTHGPGQKIHDEMEVQEGIEEYVSHFHNSYCPAEGEVCIAKAADGQWGRASCFEMVAGKDLRLQFLEFGRGEHVRYTDVRLMPEEFVKYPVLSVEGKILNAEDFDLKKLKRNVPVECTFVIKNSFLPEYIELELVSIDDNVDGEE